MRSYVEHGHTSPVLHPLLRCFVQGVREVWTMKEEGFDILTCALATGRIR
jgi:hypothetical protein